MWCKFVKLYRGAGLSRSRTTFLRMASSLRWVFSGRLAMACQRSPCLGSAATARRITWGNGTQGFRAWMQITIMTTKWHQYLQE